MKIVFQDDSRLDVAWWRFYYRKTFPQGAKNARRILAACKQSLKENPRLGQPVEGLDLHKLTIPNTPFALMYRIRGDVIEIVRLFDMRQGESDGFQEE
jgi:plasmid stabilization system protein ParE